MQDNRWTQKILDWRPDPARGRRHARPRKRWIDDLVALAEFVTEEQELSWRLLTGDRNSWRELEDGFADGEWRQA